ncbi:hypothetical protein QTO34_009525 [Cnephaeus nilssonii]|uniref:Uncharacterized protein n=1 Tax=Cnephaeus nilssonii TaxID=3371016 RepID=A0AA40HI36_CNENI|nr:hypothetical protein QTO34_009525 [Eptesicus nilssonii]
MARTSDSRGHWLDTTFRACFPPLWPPGSLSLTACPTSAPCARESVPASWGSASSPSPLSASSANALLLVPNGETTWTNTDNLSLQVWLMAGFFGGGLLVRRLARQGAGCPAKGF